MVRTLKSKIPAIIAMAVSVISFVLVLIALVVSLFETPPETGNSYSFGLWAFSLMAVIVSIVFYLIDAILMIDDLFHTSARPLAIAVIAMAVGSIPMFIFIGGGMGINILIWNAYYLGMLILQAFSLRRYIKKQPERK